MFFVDLLGMGFLAMLTWLSALDLELKVTLIGVASALLTIVLKDIGIYIFKEARADQKSETTIYRKYADPLLSASIDLFWRLREALVVSGRDEYLKNSGEGNDFYKYKYDSTIFRLAVLIGWIRAYRREITYLSLRSVKRLEPLKEAISNFEFALAEGTHVEEQRIKAVSTIWSIPTPKETETLSVVSVRVEHLIKISLIGIDGNQSELIDLDETKQLSLCKAISELLCSTSGVDPLTTDFIAKTRSDAVKALSIREAWLYRDFQSGIGDLMVKDISSGIRQFDVLGFREFEALLHSEDFEVKRWILRLHRVFDQLDISRANQYDARVLMLENVFLSLMKIIPALAKIDSERAVFAERSIKEIRKLGSDTSWRRGSG